MNAEFLQIRFGSTPSRIRHALHALLEAATYAQQTSGLYWEFAVEIEQLLEMGLVYNDLRWLVRSGFVEHQREVTLENDDGRAFRRTGDLSFTDRTCFILTDVGVRFSQGAGTHAAETQAAASQADAAEIVRVDLAEPVPSRHSSQEDEANGKYARVHVRPSWDPERRMLSLNGISVKHFKWAAENQEKILATFEEEGWPPRIDDPLPPHPDQDPKRRLSDTIKSLNRKQLNPLIHFRGDGTGEGIVWEYVGKNRIDSATKPGATEKRK